MILAEQEWAFLFSQEKSYLIDSKHARQQGNNIIMVCTKCADETGWQNGKTASERSLLKPNTGLGLLSDFGNLRFDGYLLKYPGNRKCIS